MIGSQIQLYSGEFRYALDAKNRITFPAKWRRSETEEFFVFPDRTKSCLVMMPPDQFQKIGDEVEQSTKFTRDQKRHFLRTFYSQARQTSVDRQSRMLLPDDFCRLVNLDAEVILAGGKTQIEVWNTEAWASVLLEQKDGHDAVAEEFGL